MISTDFITEWEQVAPWRTDNLIEQDLIIERALVELYKMPLVRKNLAFKGGTALNKLFIKPQARYSEDIDLSLVNRVPIKDIMDQFRDALDPWLGKPKWKHSAFGIKFFYPYTAISGEKVKLKVEINTTNYEQVFGLRYMNFRHESSYFSGESTITTYELDELMGSKLRALYSRNKGRDLFDMWLVMTRNLVDIDRVMKSFVFYSEMEENPVSRAQFEANIYAKKKSAEFRQDMGKLLAGDVNWDVDEAFHLIEKEVYHRLSGEPWKGTKKQRRENQKQS